MTTFTQMNQSQMTTTTNGAVAFKSTTSALVDLFFQMPASRGKDVIPMFSSALVEDRDLALRTALWTRDARDGAGERDLFRNILLFLEKTDVEACKLLANKTALVGRYDDLLIFQEKEMKGFAFDIIKNALLSGKEAKDLLEKLDSLSEEECQSHLNELQRSP